MLDYLRHKLKRFLGILQEIPVVTFMPSFTLAEGDIVVLTYDGVLSDRMLVKLREDLEKQLQLSQYHNRVMIIQGGLKLSKITKGVEDV